MEFLIIYSLGFLCGFTFGYWLRDREAISSRQTIGEKEHLCGCKTVKSDEAIRFNKICKKHKENRKYVFIALQHDANCTVNESEKKDG